MRGTLSTDAVTCCHSGCTTVLIETSNEIAITRADHTLCTNCRTIIICSSHFELLDNGEIPFTCPSCGENAWQHVSAKDAPPSKSEIQFQCVGIYEESYSNSASLVNHTLIVQPTNRGANVAMLDGPLAASVPGKVIAAALSPARQHLAVVFQQGHECILEVHSDSGRPWRLRSDAPLGLCAIAFFDENRLAGLNCRQEGHCELIELALESGHTVTTRRICTTSTQSEDDTPLQLQVINDAQVVTTGWSAKNYWLDTIEMSTGTKIRRTSLPYLPTLLRVGANGHILIGCPDGPVGLVKADTHVELFSQYSLRDAIFGDDGLLYLTSRTHGL